MSYSVWLEIDTGGEEPAYVCESINHTSNTVRMWDTGLGFRFRELKGMTGMEAIPHLERAVAYLVDENNRSALLEMQPANGWGTLETATEFLRELLAMCRSHPKAIVAMWH